MRTRAAVAIVGCALPALVLGVPQVGVAGDVVGPQITGQAGSLDSSFAGGVGYRAIPNPTTVLDGKRAGVGVLVTRSGAVRTIATYPTVKDGGVLYGSMLIRGWTANGWLDRSFYSGQAKTLVKYIDPVDGPALETTSVAANSTLSLSMMSYGARTFTRLHSDGTYLATRREPWSDDDDDFARGVDFLPTGAPVVCWTMADGSTRLQLFDAALLLVGYYDGMALPGGCWDLVVEGSHLWYMGTGSADAAGNRVVGIVRTDLALKPDPAWGQDGYAEVLLPFTGSLLGMSDGGAYVSNSGLYEGVVSIAKLTPAGDLDPGYGASGVARIGGASGVLGNREIWARAMVADAKGVVMAVRVRDLAGEEPWRYRLIRLTSRGGLDPAFGQGGIVQVSQEVTSLALDGSGRIVTLSSVNSGKVYLARRLG